MIMKSLIDQFQKQHKAFVVHQGEKLVRSLEDLIAKYSAVGDGAFFEVQQFPWAGLLETNWKTIRAELDNLLKDVYSIPNFQDISTDQISITQDNLWKTYFLYGYGYKAEQNCLRCPETTRLVEQIPGMKTAFFSILLSHKTIPEHRGPYKGLLRYHLGLKVPAAAEQCGIRVGSGVRHWQEGKSLIFDDTFPHSAWNHTDDMRVILFVDFIRPMRAPVSWFNQFMIQLIAWSPYVQSGRKNLLEWEARQK
ncbi:aspartyl/asparaginyl beta-hydroxylase domain-containing protein [Thermoleptolyngbya sichuanensis XZ-Cy5]|uniref:aspartyl/asparaginyl beta-hydroxylase domain-containing protein n=1 Tax=Thermoleptolyngbya sichuanensis TaxID=2885951 RepID=UPI00240D6236|nr:aspartyl/asparaginyl beta-hydroxylase domain-containing protein [Thermoleptolyngbya sichuanensis]MDG2618036.1 aspartyl/asparaginyl beta-hydroxylase domain-containing protein [Thermoleptolyngbya sichuanensis XZ-Cy5]